MRPVRRFNIKKQACIGALQGLFHSFTLYDQAIEFYILGVECNTCLPQQTTCAFDITRFVSYLVRYDNVPPHLHSRHLGPVHAQRSFHLQDVGLPSILPLLDAQDISLSRFLHLIKLSLFVLNGRVTIIMCLPCKV